MKREKRLMRGRQSDEGKKSRSKTIFEVAKTSRSQNGKAGMNGLKLKGRGWLVRYGWLGTDGWGWTAGDGRLGWTIGDGVGKQV